MADTFPEIQFFILDENGEAKAVPFNEFRDWLVNVGDRRIGREQRGGVVVSTVLLTGDIGMDRTPFETMVFGGELGGSCERYSTRAEADAGHKRWVEKVFGGADD